MILLWSILLLYFLTLYNKILLSSKYLSCKSNISITFSSSTSFKCFPDFSRIAFYQNNQLLSLVTRNSFDNIIFSISDQIVIKNVWLKNVAVPNVKNDYCKYWQILSYQIKEGNHSHQVDFHAKTRYHC